jgi:leucine-responsive regulatory protein
MNQLDNTDRKLLSMLQSNSRMTVKELSAAVNLSQTPVYERVRRLESEGYIRQYVALLDARKLDLGLTAFVMVKLIRQDNVTTDRFTRTVGGIENVVDCYGIAGTFDFLLKVLVRDMESYKRFVVDVLGNIDCVGSMETVFVLNEVKRETAIPI